MFPRIICWKHCDNRKQCSRHCSCYNIERTLREHWEREITLRKHAGNIHHPRCSQHVSSMFSSAILYQHFFSLLQCYFNVVSGNIERCPLCHPWLDATRPSPCYRIAAQGSDVAKGTLAPSSSTQTVFKTL